LDPGLVPLLDRSQDPRMRLVGVRMARLVELRDMLQGENQPTQVDKRGATEFKKLEECA